MKIKFRVLASGSNGNSAYLSTPDGTLLIDTGISRLRILKELKSDNIPLKNILGILISHAHIDHCRGLPVLHRYTDSRIYCSPGTKIRLNQLRKFDDRWSEICKNSSVFTVFNQKFRIGPFNVIPLRTIHDSPDSTAFQISYKDIKVSLITDTGILTQEHQLAIKQSDLVLLEMNHDIEALSRSNRPFWLKKRIRESHLANRQTIEFLDTIVESPLKALFLGHLSGECNSPELVSREITKWSIEQDVPWNSYICRREEPGKLAIFDGKNVKTKMNTIEFSRFSEPLNKKETLFDHFY